MVGLAPHGDGGQYRSPRQRLSKHALAGGAEMNEALRLADYMDDALNDPNDVADAVSAELRRLHAEHEEDQGVIAVWRGRTLRAEAQRDVLLEALQALYDEQNGPPLIRHQAAWEAAMEKARAAIKAVEEGK